MFLQQKHSKFLNLKYLQYDAFNLEWEHKISISHISGVDSF